jgi:hypothetical protein
MSKEYDDSKYLKDPQKEGTLLPEKKKGNLIKSEGSKGKRLWKDDEKLNEEKNKKKKLNE